MEMHYLVYNSEFIINETRSFDGIKSWLLEYDTTNHCVLREIGLGLNNNVIIKFPNKNNKYGLWGDSNISLDPSEYEKIDKSKFEILWNTD